MNIHMLDPITISVLAASSLITGGVSLAGIIRYFRKPHSDEAAAIAVIEHLDSTESWGCLEPSPAVEDLQQRINEAMTDELVRPTAEVGISLRVQAPQQQEEEIRMPNVPPGTYTWRRGNQEFTMHVPALVPGPVQARPNLTSTTVGVEDVIPKDVKFHEMKTFIRVGKAAFIARCIQAEMGLPEPSKSNLLIVRRKALMLMEEDGMTRRDRADSIELVVAATFIPNSSMIESAMIMNSNAVGDRYRALRDAHGTNFDTIMTGLARLWPDRRSNLQRAAAKC